MNVKEAVHTITKALKEDEGFYQGYQANIAMAMYDELKEEIGEHKMTGIRKEILKIYNNGAKRFLDYWISCAECKENEDKLKELENAEAWKDRVIGVIGDGNYTLEDHLKYTEIKL